MNYTALGGIDEAGKNAHVFDFEDNIIVVNFGSRKKNTDEHGFDNIIGDIGYLEKKKQHIRAIIYTNNLDGQLNTAALFRIRKLLPEVPIFMSKVTYDLFVAIEPGADAINKNYPNNIIRLFSEKDTVIEITTNLKIFLFPLPSSIPGNYGFVIEWKGTEKIFIGGDYISDSVNFWEKKFVNSFTKVVVHKVGLFFADIYNCLESNSGNNDVRITPYFEDAFKTPLVNRFFCPFYLKNISYLSELIKFAVANNCRIAFLSKKYYQVVDILMTHGFINTTDRSIFTHDLTPQENEKVIVLIIERASLLFHTIRQLLISNDKHVKIQRVSDLYVPLYTAEPGSELDHVNVVNNFIARNFRVFQRKIGNIIDCHPTRDQLLQTIAVVSPAFVIPFNGLYMNMNYFSRSLESLFPSIKSVIIKKGSIYNFDLEKLEVTKSPHKMTDREIRFFGNYMSSGTAEDRLIVQERLKIGNNGVVSISFIINPEKWLILSKIIVQGIGIYLITKNNVDIAEQIEAEVRNVFKQQQSRNSSATILKRQIQLQCSDIVWNLISKAPKFIITVINKS